MPCSTTPTSSTASASTAAPCASARPSWVRRTRRPNRPFWTPCAACGTLKRHYFDRAARDGGFDVLATGHNLDDEAAVLLGNVLHWQTEYLGRQVPVLEERPGFPRKVKPLVRLA